MKSRPDRPLTAVCNSAPRACAALLLLLVACAHADSEILNADVSQDTIDRTICVIGYTASVRPAASYTNGVKAMLLKRAGLAHSDSSAYQLDHTLPLGLGGHPRKLANLRLQPIHEAKRKDRIERKLQCLVCAGQLSLADAQHDILNDWQAALHRYARVKCQRHSEDD